MVKYVLAVLLLSFAATKVRGQNILGVITKASCEGNNLTMECSPGFIIDVAFANYGRTQSGFFVCPKYPNDRNVLCFSSNATTYSRKQCNDRTSCTVSASNSVFGDPCPGTYKYLQATYACCRYERACEDSTMKITCPIGRRIVITGADYGRTLPGDEACPATDDSTATTNTNCRAANSTIIVAKQCNYKNSCSVQASNTQFGDPCPGTYKYLQATYKCL